MWNRAQLKERAKRSFKCNYWKCVLISLLLTLIAGGGGFASGNASSMMSVTRNNRSDTHYNDSYDENASDLESFVSGVEDGLQDDVDESRGIDKEEVRSMMRNGGMMAAVIMIGIFLAIFVIIFALVLLLDVFIINPLEVGCQRFFIRNLNEPAQAGNVGYAFDNNYKNIAKTMFFRDLFIVLWTLLFIIPGIVKSYEYMMIPYLLADNPQMTKEQAFAESRRMMQGQKWKAFVLDLSFIGWHLLSTLTLGILEVFYVSPYVRATHAALYEALQYENPGNGQTFDSPFGQENV